MPQIQGNPSRKCDITAIDEASTREGKNASRITMPLSLFRAVGSSPRPARIRIITRDIILRKHFYTKCEISDTEPISVRSTGKGEGREEEKQQVRKTDNAGQREIKRDRKMKRSRKEKHKESETSRKERKALRTRQAMYV